MTERLVSVRALEGRVVGNGRYLLLRKVEHTADSASFHAKDMVGGIDVDIELHRDDERGFRLGRSDVTPRLNVLPDLLDNPGIDPASGDAASRGHDAATATRDGLMSRMRAWLRRRHDRRDS